MGIQEYFFVRKIVIGNDYDKKVAFVQKIISHHNAYKFRLVLDILYDESESLFHDSATKLLQKTLQLGGLTRSSIIDDNYDDFNVLYKYVAKSMGDEINPLDIDGFENIKSLLVEEFPNLESYSLRSVAISSQCIIYFNHPNTIIADILFEKGHDFIQEMRTQDKIMQWKKNRNEMAKALVRMGETDKTISNINRKPDAFEIEILYKHEKRTKRVNYSKLLDFLQNFEKKNQEYQDMYRDFLL
ncbi:hypothetical protein QTO01_20405 [Vibrio mytili]|uniref:hypothetical protein n=1 Tax=Vibrio mytili TaxID=50718 RepID=UPI002F413083